MRQVNFLVFILIILSSCNKEGHQGSEKNQHSGDFSVKDSQKAVEILWFDCAPIDNISELSGIQWKSGIRNWGGGGPSGASWNADKLRCGVEIETQCNTGAINYELRTGSHVVSESQFTIDRAGKHIKTFELSRDKWESNLDEAGLFSQNFPYRTITFKASVFISCQKPIEIKPDSGPRTDFSDDDLFTAGFSDGE